MKPTKNQQDKSNSAHDGDGEERRRVAVILRPEDHDRLEKLAKADFRKPGSLARLLVMKGMAQMEREAL